MVLSEIDRSLLQQCLTRAPRSWENFVDRFVGLVIHVISHAAQSRSIRLSDEDREDLVAEVFLAIVNKDFAVLRSFRGDSSLATYLTVIARRVVIRELLKRKPSSVLNEPSELASKEYSPEQRIGNREEIERLLQGLNGVEAEVIRMYHLEGKSYQEISFKTGLAENSIGPTLSRSRQKMRQADAKTG